MKIKPVIELSPTKQEAWETFLQNHHMDIDCFWMLVTNILDHFYDVDIRFQRLQSLMRNEKVDSSYESFVIINKDSINRNHTLNTNLDHYLFDDFEAFIKDNDIIMECSYAPHLTLGVTMK